MQKPIPFRDVQIDEAFTPAVGEIGCGKVYIKRINFLCPHIGTEDFALFYPNDRVSKVNIPEKILQKYKEE